MFGQFVLPRSVGIAKLRALPANLRGIESRRFTKQSDVCSVPIDGLAKELRPRLEARPKV